ncbi:DUF202 domain-containing protein [Paenibacillus aurantius]|uniref:DUF202 domain-containing protein n=1 Tax=Paenibacillus aurantius TaxID=2918900 RepID=A0AA96RDY3_9BACL|nr:DUF202 domain-containing protein [Paenibacillus aurantius]WNQ11860.1 DUF202 domain-containing protein [Paenibacillus aurantius]
MEEYMDESKYIQQHLANERTFLAWVRTSIAIIGLGFLTAGLVNRSGETVSAGALVASIGGIGAVLLGAGVLILAARDYFRKKKGISQGEYRSASVPVWTLVFALGVICGLLVLLVILMLYG